MAILAGILLLCHPVLLRLGSSDPSSSDGNKLVDAGELALALLVVVILSGLLRRYIPLDYRFWRFAHKGSLGVILIGFIHSSGIGSDLEAGALRGYWWLLIVSSAGLFIYRNVLFPFIGRLRYHVAKMEPANHNTWTLTLTPDKGDVFPYHPGQFLFLTLTA